MPDLRFHIGDVTPQRFAAAPALALALRIANARDDEEVHAVMLRVQVRLDPAQRSYSPAEEARLGELFGERAAWGRSMQPLLWTQANLAVPSFRGAVAVEVPLPCSCDLAFAVDKLLGALDDGELPLTLLFSGTVFHDAGDGRLQVSQIPWSSEARCRLPVAVWQRAMDEHYPNGAFLPLAKELLARLDRERVRRRLDSFEKTIESLLGDAGSR